MVLSRDTFPSLVSWKARTSLLTGVHPAPSPPPSLLTPTRNPSHRRLTISRTPAASSLSLPVSESNRDRPRSQVPLPRELCDTLSASVLHLHPRLQTVSSTLHPPLFSFHPPPSTSCFNLHSPPREAVTRAVFNDKSLGNFNFNTSLIF